MIGIGDGSTTLFQLAKDYASGGESYLRQIDKPVAGSVRIAVDGVELAEGTDFSVDDALGQVVLSTAPSAGLSVTAGFEFDVPVRFDTDVLSVSVASFNAGEIPNVPVVEVRL